MADEEDIRRLKQGVDARYRNMWRDSHADPALSGANLNVRSDLSDAALSGVDLNGADLIGANLIRADLRDANLSGADLIRANLSDANLYGADLRGARLRDANLIHANLNDARLRDANLSGADLIRANLSGVNLFGADLSGANLSDANLVHAYLIRANLSNAKLPGANLTEAILSETTFVNIDLTNVIGLERCDHQGPSIVDHRTLQKSSSLPIQFLRGVGLPDKLIDYLPSLLNPTFQHYSCFISYSTYDQNFVDRIYADLQNKGVRCWFAPHDLPIGGKILDEIDAAIRLRDKVLLILSEHSINSDWVEDEVKKAFEEERTRMPKQTVLFPIRLDDAVMDTKEAWAGLLRRDRNIGDFRRWKDHHAYRSSFDQVMRDLVIPPKIP